MSAHLLCAGCCCMDWGQACVVEGVLYGNRNVERVIERCDAKILDGNSYLYRSVRSVDWLLKNLD